MRLLNKQVKNKLKAYKFLEAKRGSACQFGIVGALGTRGACFTCKLFFVNLYWVLTREIGRRAAD